MTKASRVLRNWATAATALLGLPFLVGASPEAKLGATESYVKWFIESQSGDAKLAEALGGAYRQGWLLVTDLFREGKTSAEVHKALLDAGLRSQLIERGANSIAFPGRSVMFLVMDREGGCEEIYFERWRSQAADAAANLVLTGIGTEDVTGESTAEKELHLLSVELPRQGDYVDIASQSFSPLGKVVVGFVLVGGLVGCDSKPAGPPPPPPVPPAPPPLNPGTQNAQPPYAWSPFSPWPAPDSSDPTKISPWEQERLVAEAWSNRDLTSKPIAGCPSMVVDPPGIVIRTTGTLVGGLSYNVSKRRQRIMLPALNGGNTQLGDARNADNTASYFKFQVEIQFNNLTEAFYGQMVMPDFLPLTGTGSRISFKDDTPANTFPGLDPPPGVNPATSAPVFEVAGTTVRWIDAPQATSFLGSFTGWNQRKFILVYAGACGRVSHVMYLELSYAATGPTTARVLTHAQFAQAVAGWSFTPP
jgi:hypothetical protein